MELRQKSVRRQYKARTETSAKIFAPYDSPERQPESSVLDLCEEIYRLETRGDLAGAIRLLAPYWAGFGAEMKLAALNKTETAQMLLRIGSVASAVGDAEQIAGAQEKARDCLSLAEDIFDDLEDLEGKAQCQNKTGVTYWRNGDLETAQIYFRESLARARSDESKAIANLNIAMTESLSFRYSSALKYYEKAFKFIGNISIFTEAKIRNGMGLVYKNIGNALTDPERTAYFDKAIIEFEGALICYEEVQNDRSAISARNNIGFLYYSIGLYDEAIRTLESAGSAARLIGDKNLLSIVSDTLARAFIAQGNYRQGVAASAASVRYLESSENSNLLATSLITYAIALARSGDFTEAKAAFYRAEEVAAFIQDFTLVAAARLFALRELFSEYRSKERLSAYLYAVKNLSGNQEKEISDALGKVAAKIELENELPTAPSKEKKLVPQPLLLRQLPQPFSLDEQLKSISREYMRAAIREARGNQSQAARLLGMSRQTFLARIKKDFPDLLSELYQTQAQVEKLNAPMAALPLIYYKTNSEDEKLAVTEIQADYREIHRGDVLIVKLGLPETSTYVITRGQGSDNELKIGFFIKTGKDCFLESAAGSRFALNETGKTRIIGKIVGFCRRADFRRFLAERDCGQNPDLTYETLKV